MIFSGMPGVSGLGAFVLGRGYSVPVPVAETAGNYDATLSLINTYACSVQPTNPVGLITEIFDKGLSVDPAIFQSENAIPED